MSDRLGDAAFLCSPVKRITFEYRSVNRREGKATVLVYGQH